MRYDSNYNPVDELFGKKKDVSDIGSQDVNNQSTVDDLNNIQNYNLNSEVFSDLNSNINNEDSFNEYDSSDYEQKNHNIINNSNKSKIFSILKVVIFIVFLVIIALFIIKVIKQREEIRQEVALLTDEITISAVGFEFNKPFDKNTFEYDLEIDTQKVQIKCTKREQVEGCNQIVNLANKDNYDHIIKYTSMGGKEYLYTIHISKKNTASSIIVDSVQVYETNYTNSDTKVVVNVLSNNGLQYSFDGGNTWQDSNEYKITKNQKLNILIRNTNGDVVYSKSIKIDNIDKVSPTVDITIKERKSDKIILSASANDELSGIDSYNWNNKGYSNNTLYTVTAPGTYTVVVKDKAGNVSSESSITILKSTFDSSIKKEKKTYSVKFVSNGANISKEILTCSTYELSCNIKLPNITREGAIIIGWAEDSNATQAKYKVLQEIEITGNKTLYAITLKKLTATFEGNGASVQNSIVSCDLYNENTVCDVKAPNIMRNGFKILGFSENATSTTATYKQSSTISLTSDKTFYAITSKVLTATFDLNGAKSLSYVNKSCTVYNKNVTCIIKAPTITKSGWETLGFSENAASTTATYKQSSNIEISSNKTLYAITKKELTATFNKNGATELSEYTSICNVYNKATTCNVKAPTITKSGWETLGFAQSSKATTATYKQASNIEISSNKTFYAITSKKITVKFEINDNSSLNYTAFDYIEYSSKTCTIYNNNTRCPIRMPFFDIKGLYGTGFVLKKSSSELEPQYISQITYDFENSMTLYASFYNYTVSENIYNRVKERVIYSNSKGKIIIDFENGTTSAVYKKLFSSIIKNAPYLFSGNLKIMVVSPETFAKLHPTNKGADGITHGNTENKKITFKYDSDGNYKTVIHELAHRWDYMHKNTTGKMISDDFLTLYEEYKNQSNRPLRDYSYNNVREFFADAIMVYYCTYIDSSINIGNLTLTPDIKALVEKYIKSA